LQELGQGGVEWAIKPLDALEGGADRQPLAIDFLSIGDDARDGAEAAHHASRLGIGELRHTAYEEFRIELVGLAIDVEIVPRKSGRNQRRAQVDDRLEQLVDVAVFGLSQCARVEPGGLKERLGVDAARVRRAEDHRSELLAGSQKRKWGRQLC